MNRIRLCITHGGNVRGLWTDQIDWRSIGRLTVRRASYVEYHNSAQKWVVRAWRPRSRVRRVLQWLTGRPFGEVLYLADTREEALDWEQRYYGIGGPGWQDLLRRS